MPPSEFGVNIDAPCADEYCHYDDLDDRFAYDDDEIIINADVVDVTPIWSADGEWDRLENDLLGDDEREGRLRRLEREIQELRYIARRAGEREDRQALRRLDDVAGRAIGEARNITASLADAQRLRELADLCSYLPHFEDDVRNEYRALWRTRKIEMAPDDARRALACLRAAATAAATEWLARLVDRDRRLLAAFLEARAAMSTPHWSAWVSDSLTLSRPPRPVRGRQVVPLPAGFTAPEGDSLAARRRHRRNFRQAIEIFYLHEAQHFRRRSPHLSTHGQNIHKYLDEKTQKFLESHRIEPIGGNDQEAREGMGDWATLAEAAERNQRARIAAAVTLSRALVDLARRDGDTILFVTLTLPPRWHPAPTVGRNSWDGSLPDAAKAEQAARWSRLRAREASRCRRAARGAFHGIRTVEPHADQCPHLHALVITDDKARTSAAIRALWSGRRAAKIDDLADLHTPAGTPLATETELIIGYILKYITASLATEDGGDGDDLDEEGAGKASPGVRGWASVWGFRRFALFGLPSGAMGLWTLMARHFYYQSGRGDTQPMGSRPFDTALAAYRRWDESHQRWLRRRKLAEPGTVPDLGTDRDYRALRTAARALGILPGQKPRLTSFQDEEEGKLWLDQNGVVVHRNPSYLTYKIVRDQPVAAENPKAGVTVIPSRPSGPAALGRLAVKI